MTRAVFLAINLQRQSLVALGRIQREAAKVGRDLRIRTFFNFVGGALLQSLKLLVTYSRESQRLPFRIAPAELDRKSPAFRVHVPPSVSHFRQYGFQPL